MNTSLLPPSISRREFLRRTVAGAAVTAGALAAPNLFAAASKIPVGVQLYSLRSMARTDLPGAIKTAAGIGFKGVEFAGYFDHTAADLKKVLDDNGLVACGTHAPYESVKADQLQKTIEFNHIIGNKFIIVPSMSARTAEEWKAKAEEFNQLAEKLKPEGMRIGYHSHAGDFKKVDGNATWEIFGENTKPDVILQLDTGNCTEGGGDVIAELKKFPGRTRSLHVKPAGAGPEAVIGEDKLDWKTIFDICETSGGIEWYVIEHETSKDPADCLRRSYAAMKKFGKA